MLSPLLGLALSLAVLPQSTEQLPPEPVSTDLTEEVEVRFVIVDALVVDSDGRIVPDLAPEDFKLYVDLQRHPIETVDLHCPAGATEDPRPVARGEQREAPLVPGVARRIALTVDYRHLPQTHRIEVIERVEEMVLNNIAPGEELMVAAITARLRVEQPFTSDRSEVLSTLARMKHDPSLWQEPPAIDTRIGYTPTHLHQFDFYDALTSLIQLLAGYDGIKAIVLFSDLPSPGGSDFDYDRQFEAVSAAATQSRTSVYPVHARGLTVGPSSEGLARLAVDTGGRFTRNTNDLSLAYARAQRDLACRYAIGFHDPYPDSDTVHRVNLKVRRPGVRAHHATFYRFGSSEDAKDSLGRTAYTAPLVFESKEVRGRVFPIRPRSNKMWHAAIELRFTVGVPEGGYRVVQFGGKLDDASRRAVYHLDRSLTIHPAAGLAEQPIVVVEPVDLPPGAYELSIVVNDPATDEPRTAVIAVELPPLPRKGVVLVEPMLAREAAGDLFVHWGADPFTMDGEATGDYEPILPRNSIMSGPLTAVAHLCRVGSKRSRPRVQIERTVRGAVETKREPLEIELGGKGAVHCEALLDVISTEALEPGEYRYEILARSDLDAEPIVRHAVFSYEPPVPVPVPPVRPEPSPAIVAIAPAETEILWPEPVEKAPEIPLLIDLPPLEMVLDRLTSVADLYASNALKFTADEVTQVYNYLGDRRTPRKMRLVNVYSYYRDEEGLLLDRRIRKSAIKGLENAQSIEEIHAMIEAADDPMSEWRGLRGKHDVPAYLERPYNWIRFFSRENRQDYHYEIEPADSPGRMLIRFRPKQDGDEQDWYGAVVVDRESFQIVHAEALQAPDYWEERRMEHMLESSEDPPADVAQRTFMVRTVSTDFSILEHGLRFPSRVEVSIYWHTVVGSRDSKRKRTTLASHIIQTYENYRFFDVEVMVDYVQSLNPE